MLLEHQHFKAAIIKRVLLFFQIITLCCLLTFLCQTYVKVDYFTSYSELYFICILYTCVGWDSAIGFLFISCVRLAAGALLLLLFSRSRRNISMCVRFKLVSNDSSWWRVAAFQVTSTSHLTHGWAAALPLLSAEKGGRGTTVLHATWNHSNGIEFSCTKQILSSAGNTEELFSRYDGEIQTWQLLCVLLVPQPFPSFPVFIWFWATCKYRTKEEVSQTFLTMHFQLHCRSVFCSTHSESHTLLYSWW